MSQICTVEDVLSLVDISNDGSRDSQSSHGGMDHNQMGYGNSENSLFQNEMMQINHISQLFVGLNVFSLLFFQLSGMINRDRI